MRDEGKFFVSTYIVYHFTSKVLFYLYLCIVRETVIYINITFDDLLVYDVCDEQPKTSAKVKNFFVHFMT